MSFFSRLFRERYGVCAREVQMGARVDARKAAHEEWRGLRIMTSVEEQQREVPRVASPRVPHVSARSLDELVLERLGPPSGGAWSTADELTRFAGALLGHRLLGAAMTATVLEGRVAKPREATPADCRPRAEKFSAAGTDEFHHATRSR
jgi:hypothetical protein